MAHSVRKSHWVCRVACLAAVTVAVAALVVAAGFERVQDAKEPPSTRQKEPRTVISVLKKAETFRTLVKAMEEAELIETLEGEGPFTIFAPDDEAFEKLPTGTLEQLMKEENRDQFKDILLYHVASGRFAAEQVTRLKEIESVEGSAIATEVADGKIQLNGRVEVTRTDLVADNGVVHVINGVLMPEK